MHKLLLAAALLVALFSTGFSSVPSASASPLADLSDEALAAHNAFRQQVAREESQRLGGTVVIPDLTWNSDLAAYAQAWADQLLSSDPNPANPFAYGSDPNNPDYPHHPWSELNALGRGENIYAGWSEGDATLNESAQAAVDGWKSERPYYNYDTNTCSLGKYKCGHYTQLVWSTTTQVGCGQAVRTTAYGRHYVVWVCNYAPAGNINIEVQRPYSVTPGTPGCTTYNWTRWLELGSYGDDVVALQMWLSAAGEEVYQTGVFDSTTDAAVRHFQAVNGLVVDGIVGPQTQAALNRICPKFKRLGRHR
ncbi:MAG: CAP domain-containing protein [Roseiflexaceae bacterium]